MDIRKKLLSILGVLALTMSMAGSIALAQESAEITSEGMGITFLVNCSAANAGTSSTSIGRSDGVTGNVVFPPYDAGDTNQTGTVSTEANAFRITVNPSCLAQTSGFSLTANITDFTTDATPALSFSGSNFQFTHSNNLWTVTGTTDVPADNVSEPDPSVEFTGTNGSYASSTLAQTTGATNSSMYMDFTGVLVGLDNTIAAGSYSAVITLTLNTGTAP